jgi:hypothetical protein
MPCWRAPVPLQQVRRGDDTIPGREPCYNRLNRIPDQLQDGCDFKPYSCLLPSIA